MASPAKPEFAPWNLATGSHMNEAPLVTVSLSNHARSLWPPMWILFPPNCRPHPVCVIQPRATMILTACIGCGRRVPDESPTAASPARRKPNPFKFPKTQKPVSSSMKSMFIELLWSHAGLLPLSNHCIQAAYRLQLSHSDNLPKKCETKAG